MSKVRPSNSRSAHNSYSWECTVMKAVDTKSEK